MSADMLPMEPSQFEESADIDSGMDSLLGKVFQVGDKKFRLVQLNKSGGFASAGKLFKWSSRSAWTVTPVTAQTDRTIGIGDIGLGTVSNDAYFLIQCAGRCELIQGDDTGNYVTAGNYVKADNDADTGKAVDGGSTFTEGVTFGVAVDTATADGSQVTVDIVGTLV